jgi:hypothetical protein
LWKKPYKTAILVFLIYIFILSAQSNDHMNRLILSLCIPFVTLPVINGGGDPSPTSLAEVRTGEWPITLERMIERRDTSYFLEYRNEEVLDGIAMDTLPFPNLTQLKYLGKALSALKTGSNGDIAKFSNYSVKRADKKPEGVFFILRFQWGSTEFRQPEADIMINTIKNL